MLKYKMLLEEEENDDDFVEIIIGKDGDYTIDENGNIVIKKKETGGPEQSPPPSSGKGGNQGEGEQEGSESKDGEGEKGEQTEEIGEGSGINEIDEHHKKIEERIKAGKDLSSKEAKEKAKEDEAKRIEAEKSASKGGRGKGSDANPQEIDYSKIQPKFNWQQLIKMFIASAGEETEETYQKPSRRSISGIHTARQTGAGAMKPGENILDAKEVKLAFVIDSSGSMSSVISTMYANIANLLKSNARLANSLFTIIKFSDNWHAWKGMFKSDKAVAVKDVLEKPNKFDGKMSVIFKQHYGSVTNFSSDLRENLQKLVKAKI